MIFGVTNYSPLDLDVLLTNCSRTLNLNESKDVGYAFSMPQSYSTKVVVLFNSQEYCSKREDIKILDLPITKVADKIIGVVCKK